MEKIQKKLKESVEKQSLESLGKLSSLLEGEQPMEDDQDDADDDAADTALPAIDAAETTFGVAPSEIRGENKAPVTKRSKRRKHQLARRRDGDRGGGIGEKPSTRSGSKPRPRFFCQF
jgi:hypothetical protein